MQEVKSVRENFQEGKGPKFTCNVAPNDKEFQFE